MENLKGTKCPIHKNCDTPLDDSARYKDRKSDGEKHPICRELFAQNKYNNP